MRGQGSYLCWIIEKSDPDYIQHLVPILFQDVMASRMDGEEETRKAEALHLKNGFIRPHGEGLEGASMRNNDTD